MVCSFIFVSGCLTGVDTDGDGDVDDISVDISVDEVASSIYETDSDGDGYADEEDAFPNDDRYYLDSDGDGYADEVDDFPNDDRYYLDSDGDGYADEVDDFPHDSRYHSDYDQDGYADEVDVFPSNSKYHSICSVCDGSGYVYSDYEYYVEFTSEGNVVNMGLFNPDYYYSVTVTNIDSHDGTFEAYVYAEDNGVKMWEDSKRFFIGSGGSHEFEFHYDADEEMDYFYKIVTPPTYTETVKSTCSQCYGTGKI